MIAQKSGSIILTATVDARIGCAGLDAYTAAKDGVRVNTICPGFVATEPQMDWLRSPGAASTMSSLHLLPVATPEQIAPFALYLASDESAVVTGGVFPIEATWFSKLTST